MQYLLKLSALLWGLIGSDPLMAAEDDPALLQVNVVCTEYPPFLSASSPGKGRSFMRLESLLQKNNRWKFHPVFLPPPRIHNYINNSQDWLFSFIPVSVPAQDVKAIVIADDFLESGFFRLQAPTPFIWLNLQQYRGKRVVIIRSLTEDDTESRLIDAGMTVITVNHVRQGLRMLFSGRADFVQAVKETGYYFAAEEGLNTERLQFTDPPAAVYPLTLYINSLHPLAKRFEDDLHTALQNGK